MRRPAALVVGLLATIATIAVCIAHPLLAQAAPTAPTITIPKIDFGVSPATKPSDVALSLQILLLLTVLTLAPTMLILVTSFTRIIIVLSFVRTAMGTQAVPPTQILVGLALLLTFFVMKPTFDDVNRNAIQPYLANRISQPVAL
jgi:flagellar biosynthetic protein FliP